MKMLKTLAAVIFAAALPCVALAQTSPNLTQGQVLTPGQWNNLFASKQDTLGFTPMNVNGGVFLGRVVTAPPGASTSGLNLTPGTAPGSPANGDLWVTAAGLFAQVNGATVGPLITATTGAFTSTGSISATGADANLAAGGNRAFMDFASGSARIGALNGGGSAAALQILSNGTVAGHVDTSQHWILGTNVNAASSNPAAVTITGNASNTAALPFSGTALHLVGLDNLRNYQVMNAYGVSGGVGVPNGLGTYAARGTQASPTATQSGDTIFNFLGSGYGTTGFGSFDGLFSLNAAENFTDTAQGTNWQFSTNTVGSTTSVRRMMIQAGVVIGNATSGDMGAGTLNLAGSIYINGTPVSGSGTMTSANVINGTGLTETGTCSSTTSITCTLNVDKATAANVYAGTSNKVLTADGVYTSTVGVSFSATPTFDLSTFINASMVLTGNITSITIANIKAGQSGVIYFQQDATGSRTLPATFNANFKFAGGVQPVLSTAPSALDAIFYSCVATNYCFASISKSFN